MRRRSRLIGALLATVGLASGCSALGLASDDPTWVDQPQSAPLDIEPRGPVPDGPLNPDDPTGPGEGEQAEDPNVIATGLDVPWGLALLPDGAALVGERETGRVLRVEPVRAPVRELMTIGGLDTSGDGGLLGLALSPAYAEDRLVFAYVTTATDNRILRFEIGGTPQPILTGIPKGRTGNGGRIEFGPDGYLYIGTGDTGDPAAAADPASLAGKVLRVDAFGEPAPDNPGGTAVYASGFHDVRALCFDPREHLYVADVGTGGTDEIDLVEAGGDYGWPSGRDGAEDPALTLPAEQTEPGGCAVVRFGLFVSALAGTKIWAVPVGPTGQPGTPKGLLAGTYGRLRTVVAAPDGALWISTSNRDGHGDPAPDDDKILRILPPDNTTNSPV